MDEVALREELLKGEDSSRQFKRQLNDEKHLAEELVALLNSKGGRIYVGVDDDGSIKGIAPSHLGRLNNLIGNAGSQHVEPPTGVLTENVQTLDGLVVVISVEEGADKPYQTSDGSFWVKKGADKRRVTNRSELQRMFQAAHAVYAESRSVAGTSIQDLNFDRYATFFEEKYSSQPPLNDADRTRELTASRLMDENGNLTIAGVLLFARQPQRLLPEFTVKAVWFKGTERASTDYYDNRVFEGTLPQQYEDTMAFLRRWNSRVQASESFNGPTRLEIPDFVFEELVVNALVHRDYFIRDSIKILIFDDRIEIRSPGRLPNSLTVEALKRGIRRDRNPVILSFAYDLMRYRGLGSGILRVLKAVPTFDVSVDDEAEEVSCSIRLPNLVVS